MPYCDIAMVFDPVTFQCNLAFDGLDLVVDRTPVTPLLVALGTDRRAQPDDPLPDTEGPLTGPKTFIAKRGWCGDALDSAGRLIGSRLWLVSRMKQTEATRQFAEGIVVQAVEEVERLTGLSALVQVAWVRRGVLGVRVAIGADVVSLEQALAA